MIEKYKGQYIFDANTLYGWDSNSIGVYYCGRILPNGNLYVFYVGKSTSNNGIKGRLLQHLGENKWNDVTHFGFVICSTPKEAEEFEAFEIKRLQPKYNILLK